MLSLAKTKEREELKSWLGDKEGLLSWKLDGLTIVLTYEGGQLVKAVTRGNGEVGEVITPNARVFRNIPAGSHIREVWCCAGKRLFRTPSLKRSTHRSKMRMPNIKIRGISAADRSGS